MYGVGSSALDAEHDETEFGRGDAGVVQAISNGARWSCAVDSMALDA